MKLSTTSENVRVRGRFAAVVLMLSLWVGLCALDFSPELHRFLHKDASNPTHNCLITQLQHHAVLSGFTPAVLPAVPVVPGLLAHCEYFQFSSGFDYRLSPSRAPPLA